MIVEELVATLGLKPIKGEWAQGEQLIESIKHGLELLAGAEAIKSLAEMVKGVIETGDHALKAAQKIGVTAAAYQELSFAAKMVDVDQEQLTHGLEKFARGLEEARTKGTGPFAEALQKLNIPLRELTGETLDQNLEVIAEKFKEMPDGAHKTATAMELFGKSGAELIPLLNKGKDGIVAFRNRAEELGVVLTDETAKSMEELNDQSKEIGAVWQGLKNTVVSALLPTLKEMITGLLAWVQANREVIASGIRTAVEALVFIFKAFGEAIGAVVDVVQFLRDHTELLIGVLGLVGGILLEIAADAVIAWAAFLGPIALIVAAVTALGLVLYDVWKSITTGKGIAASAFRWIAWQARDLYHAFANVAGTVRDFFVAVAVAIRAAVEAVIEWVAGKVEWIAGKVKGIVDTVKGAVATVTNAVGAGDADTEGSTANVMSANHMGWYGAPSPAAAAGNSTTNVAPGAVSIVVNADGVSADDVGAAVTKHVSHWWDGQMRDARAASGGGDQ